MTVPYDSLELIPVPSDIENKREDSDIADAYTRLSLKGELQWMYLYV